MGDVVLGLEQVIRQMSWWCFLCTRSQPRASFRKSQVGSGSSHGPVFHWIEPITTMHQVVPTAVHRRTLAQHIFEL